MNEKTTFLRKWLSEIDAAHAKAEQEYRVQRASIVRLLEAVDPKNQEASAAGEISHTTAGSGSNLILVSHSANDSNSYGEVNRAVKDAVLSLRGEFTVKNVADILRERAPSIAERVNGNLSGMLWKFNKKDGIIRQVSPGIGRRPATYIKK